MSVIHGLKGDASSIAVEVGVLDKFCSSSGYVFLSMATSTCSAAKGFFFLMIAIVLCSLAVGACFLSTSGASQNFRVARARRIERTGDTDRAFAREVAGRYRSTIGGGSGRKECVGVLGVGVYVRGLRSLPGNSHWLIHSIRDTNPDRWVTGSDGVPRVCL